MHSPDVLVLGAGGDDGAAWMAGVLAGIAEASGIEFGAVEQLLGTSAGAMLAADLLAGVEPRPPRAVADEGTADGEPAEARSADSALRAGLARLGAVATPLVPFTLAAGRPVSSRLRAAALARIESPPGALDGLRERIAGHGLAFDGRLRVACVERASGRRVVFGAPGAPAAGVAEAVQASCSVPWRHRAVRIGEQEYVDGAVWSPTNLDAAPALRETHVLCLAPMGGQLGPRPRHAAIDAAATAALALETLVLRGRGAHVTTIVPDAGANGDGDLRLAGYRQGLAFARRR